MSREYTTALIKEIDLYIDNLHNFQNFDIAPLEEEYEKYIDRVNTMVPYAAADALKGLELKQQNYDNFSMLLEEAQKELDVLERQLRVLEDSDAPIKRNINSLKSKIKKAKTELEETKQLLNDPLRRLLGYRAKDSERIAELEATIKTYNEEISALELQRDPDEIKNVKSRISSVKSRIEDLKTEKRATITNKDGNEIKNERQLEGLCGWFITEYRRQRNIWLGKEQPYKDDLYSPQILHEYKKCFARVDLLDISGYSLMNYKNLFEIICTYPITMDYNKIKLDERFSALCQQKFISIRRACPKNYGEIELWKNVCEKTLKTAFTNTVFPTNPREIKNEQFENMIFREVEVKNSNSKNAYSIPNGDYAYSVSEFIKANEETTIKEIRDYFKLGNGLLLRTLEELRENGIIDDYDRSDMNSTIRYIGTTNAENVEVVKECLINEIYMEDYLKHKKDAAEKLLQGLYINKSFLLEIKEMITQNPEMDLPDIIIALREDEMDYYEIANELLSFRNLYRATPEQILKTNQQFFAEKEIAQLKENARKEREMYERQAELDREAENDRARMMASAERERAQAERERAAAEDRRTETMAYQARLDREAADKRAADERYEAGKMAQRNSEIARREAEYSAEIARREANKQANASKMAGISKCSNCANSRHCPSYIKNNGGGINCGGYVPYGAK